MSLTKRNMTELWRSAIQNNQDSCIEKIFLIKKDDTVTEISTKQPPLLTQHEEQGKRGGYFVLVHLSQSFDIYLFV